MRFDLIQLKNSLLDFRSLFSPQFFLAFILFSFDSLFTLQEYMSLSLLTQYANAVYYLVTWRSRVLHFLSSFFSLFFSCLSDLLLSSSFVSWPYIPINRKLRYFVIFHHSFEGLDGLCKIQCIYLIFHLSCRDFS